MRLLYLVSLTLFVLSCATQLQAQNTAHTELQWKSDQIINLQNNETLSIASVIKSYTNNSIEWVQRDGAKIYSYTITNVSGSWSDVSQVGEITYSISSGETTGTFVFSRQMQGITATLRLEREGTVTSHFRFNIISIEQL